MGLFVKTRQNRNCGAFPGFSRGGSCQTSITLVNRNIVMEGRERMYVRRAPATFSEELDRTMITGPEMTNVRMRLGLTQEEFGKLIGVSRFAIIRAEKDGPSKMTQVSYALAKRKGLLRIRTRSKKQ